MKEPKTDYLAILLTLTEHGVDFVIVGGVGAVLHGAPISTFDIDLVHSRDEENVQRLSEALLGMDAHYRTQPERCIRPTVEHLAGPGHQLLMTKYGPLDLLGTVGSGLSYSDLAGDTILMDLGGVEVQVLNLARLISIKEQTAGEKDRAVLPVLRRTLEEKMRRLPEGSDSQQR